MRTGIQYPRRIHNCLPSSIRFAKAQTSSCRVKGRCSSPFVMRLPRVFHTLELYCLEYEGDDERQHETATCEIR